MAHIAKFRIQDSGQVSEAPKFILYKILQDYVSTVGGSVLHLLLFSPRAVFPAPGTVLCT